MFVVVVFFVVFFSFLHQRIQWIKWLSSIFGWCSNGNVKCKIRSYWPSFAMIGLAYRVSTIYNIFFFKWLTEVDWPIALKPIRAKLTQTKSNEILLDLFRLPFVATVHLYINSSMAPFGWSSQNFFRLKLRSVAITSTPYKLCLDTKFPCKMVNGKERDWIFGMLTTEWCVDKNSIKINEIRAWSMAKACISLFSIFSNAVA